LTGILYSVFVEMSQAAWRSNNVLQALEAAVPIKWKNDTEVGGGCDSGNTN
jgi:hypothetical protein